MPCASTACHGTAYPTCSLQPAALRTPPAALRTPPVALGVRPGAPRRHHRPLHRTHRRRLSLHYRYVTVTPQEALANGCRIANAAVRADILRAEPAARLCRSAGGYVPMTHLGGGRYRADTSGTTMALAAVRVTVM